MSVLAEPGWLRITSLGTLHLELGKAAQREFGAAAVLGRGCSGLAVSAALSALLCEEC